MPAISTTFSVHWSKDLQAHSVGTDGAPLQLQCIGENFGYGADLIIYTYDQVLTDRLVVAINEAVAARKAELATEAAKAA